MSSPTALIHHPTLAHYLRFMATTMGRDKLLRTIQYFSRFYAWYLFRTNAPQSSIAPFEAIKSSFGKARKLMRVGKNLEHLKAAVVFSEMKTVAQGGKVDAFEKYCKVGRQLGYAGYLSFDLLTVPDAIGAWKWSKAKEYSQTAYKCWLAGLSFSAVGGVYGLLKLREREQGLGKADGESALQSKMIQKERAALQLQLLSDLCDLTVPSSALKYIELDDGIVGLAGTCSSLIGLYGAWKKCA